MATSPIRVVVGEDQALVREGIIRMLERSDIGVVGVAADATTLVDVALAERPDIVLTDIQMPPGNADDGLRAALKIRSIDGGIGIIVLSQFLDDRFAIELVGHGAQGMGYLLKEKIASPEVLIDAVRRVAAGDSALDPDVIARLVGRKRVDSPLDTLSRREHEVLALMAQGHSNSAIARALVVTIATVERHVTAIFTKLDLQPSELDQHRRVRAVLLYLQK